MAMIPHDERAERLARNLDWNLLRTFVVIVEEQNLSRAADRLGLKQPTLSNALKRLEDHIGKRLIDRSPGHFRVTDAGQLLYTECREILGTVIRFGVLMRTVRQEVQGHVTLNLASHVVSPLFNEVLADFHRAHPLATLSIAVMPSRQAIDNVSSRRASMAIGLAYEKSPRLEYRRLYREFFGLFCGPGHPLFGKSGLVMEDLQGHALVSFSTDRLSDVLRPIAVMRATYGLGDKIVASSSHLEEVRRLIVAGLGLGPLPIHVVERDVKDGLLWRLPPYKNPPPIDVYLVYNPKSKLNRAEEALLSLLKEKIDTTLISRRTYGNE